MSKSDGKGNNDGVTRRELLGTGAVVGAGVLTARMGRALGKVPKKAPEQIPRKRLGKTGQKVPILLFGGSVDLDPVFDRKLAEAQRYGMDYIDAAQVYGGGSCEPAVGSYLARAGIRDKVWITSKSKPHSVDGYQRALKKSLKSLRTNYIDLYFLHALQDPSYLSKEMAKTAERLKKAGTIRYFGFSCHHGNVAELLQKAAELPWIDVVMFRYNFRQYGNKELNKAMDAAAKADVGLIAMKTQGSAASFEKQWKKQTKGGKWTKHQAVLKAVWADDRISAAVSHMDNLSKLRENIAAAVDKTKLSATDWAELDRYASATRSQACDGCDHICGAAVAEPVAIGDTMRFLMYHDAYGERDKARRLFAELPPEARALDGVDFAPAAAACPHGVDLVGHMRRARKILT